ncbi:hypothetical protein OG562_25015 [Streptomyces sp. NBC_01275]|uniref:hypothetical protein n=1 Tax=Streptomyces sp. NBC_01275 TaxID=2903807 RepID=UPI002251EF0D|nr:hypothetical protein [Streptomyces sp. NBC_01275]MCX4764159.1 hypothetical protein [Streptomyces sp. NBC_01275]
MNPTLLTIRSALIFLLATLVGVGTGILTFISGAGVAKAVLAGAGGFGLAVPFFNALIG